MLPINPRPPVTRSFIGFHLTIYVFKSHNASKLIKIVREEFRSEIHLYLSMGKTLNRKTEQRVPSAF